MESDKERVETLVSIVILTWNRMNDLRETLEKIALSDHPSKEVIVVDNNSTDGTGEMLKRHFPHVIHLPQKENLGIRGYNIGFKAARGEFIVVLDSDSYPEKSAISRMLSLFRANPDAGAVAFDVHSHEAETDKEINDEFIADVVGYHGAGTGFRREVFQKAGYWFEPFFLYFNEMDHALSMLKEGYRIIRSPHVRAFHKSSIAARPSARGAYFYSRNLLWLIWRHYPLKEMLVETVRFLYHAVSESIFQKTAVYLIATRDAFGSAGEILKTRKPIPKELFAKVRIPLPLVFSRWA